jgi:predicted histone-like DNA-binding protein
MAIKFFRLKRKVNINGVVVEKYMAQMQVETVIDFDKLAELIDQRSTMSRGDIRGVLSEVESICGDMLLLGHKLNFGDLGSFCPGMKAIACDTPEEVTSETITKFYTIFKPSKTLKKKFKEAVFHLGDNKVRGVKYKKKD